MKKYIVTPTFPGECEFVPHEHGDVYLASDVDARIAELEASNGGLANVIADRGNRIRELEHVLMNVLNDEPDARMKAYEAIGL